MGRILSLLVVGTVWVGCADEVGNASCIGVDVQHDQDSCITTLSRCDDGHGYDVKCIAGKCACSVDGKAVGAAKGTDCPADRNAVNAACGWTLR